MANKTQPAIYLRSALNSGETATTLAAFSPDIIPLDQVQANPVQLVSTYNDFVAHTIDVEEPTTSVYIRGKQNQAVANPTVVSLRAVPNELILWPQVWETANVIGHTKLDYTGYKQVVVGSAPIQYTPIPIEEGHSHATLIATCDATFTAPTVENWRDLVEHVGKNPSLAFYNVQTADPTARHAQLTTKFRLIENEATHVELFFALETMGIPKSGIDASLNVVGKGPGDTPFSFAIERQQLSGPCGKNVKVPSGFEGTITLDVFNYDKHVFGNYSSISIVVYAVKSSVDVLLGAEHLMFDSNPRVKNFARGYGANKFSRPAVQTEQSNLATAPLYYFRCSLSENGNFPRSGNVAGSPDIQPLGTVQDPNPGVTLANFNVDVSSQRQISVYSNTSNYIYLRGHGTKPGRGRVRLFYVPGQILIHPSLYTQPSHVVFDVDDNNNPITAYRQYSSTTAQPIVVTRPFTLNNLPPDHYCCIAECLPDGETQWPHEKISNFATGAEFCAWILSEPCVAWRNLNWEPNPRPDSQTLQTSFTIPPGYSSTDRFQFQVQAVGCSLGSSFSVTSDDPAILFPQIPITSDPTIATSAFTGKSPGFNCQVTIHWFANGKPVKTGQNLSAVLIQIVPAASNVGQLAVTSPIAVNAKMITTHVGKSYPNLIDPTEIAGRRMKIGGAIRAKMLGEANDDAEFISESHDSAIPIFRGIIVGTDSIRL